MEINIFAYSGLANAVTSICLAVFILANNYKSVLVRLFAFFALSVGYWATAYFFWMVAKDESFALLSIRHAMLGAIFIPISFTYFTNRLLGKGYKALDIFNIAACALFVVFSFHPFFIKSVEPRLMFPFWPVPGFLFHFMLAYFLINVTYSNMALLKAYRAATGLRRKQIWFTFLGSATGFFGGCTNYFLWYHIPIPPILNILVSVYMAFVAYAIVAHRLMDISVIVKRTLVFTGLFAMVMGIVSLVSITTQTYLDRFFAQSNTVSTGISVLLAIILYDPCKKLLTHMTDKFLFQKKFKVSTMMAQASQAIAFVQSLKWLSRRIIAFLVSKCRIKSAVVYIQDAESDGFLRGALRGYLKEDYPPESLPQDSALFQYLHKIRGPISRDHLENQMAHGDVSLPSPNDLTEIMNFFNQTKAQVIIPSFLRRRIAVDGMGKELAQSDEVISLRDILILGAKKSDEPYTDEDLEVFYGLAQESAIAIENARLYDEAVKKQLELANINKTLGNTNEKLKVTQASLIVAEKNSTMVGMAQAIGHEVNNPLTIIIMRVDTILQMRMAKVHKLMEKISERIATEDFESLSKALKGIEDDTSRASRSAHRINAVIHTLTDILKDTKGEMGALSLKVLCHEALEATRFSTYEENLSGCELRQDIAANVMIMGNLEQLLQVFVNLIKNAYEAMGEKPERRIIIRGDVDPDDSNMAMIEFCDNGPGIPADVLPKVFGQGFSTKIRKDDSIGAAGQGQGLFVCKHMIESVHRGKMDVESVEGEGTTFIIRLPLAEGSG